MDKNQNVGRARRKSNRKAPELQARNRLTISPKGQGGESAPGPAPWQFVSGDPELDELFEHFTCAEHCLREAAKFRRWADRIVSTVRPPSELRKGDLDIESRGSNVWGNFWIKLGFTVVQRNALREIAKESYTKRKHQTVANAAYHVMCAALAHWDSLDCFDTKDRLYCGAEGVLGWRFEQWQHRKLAAIFQLDYSGKHSVNWQQSWARAERL